MPPTPLHSHSDGPWRHAHQFDAGNAAAERGTRWVLLITLLMMVAELVAGAVYGSMALLADGLHMGSHAVAIGLSVLAYAAARRLSADPRFAFGTWKIEVLAGFASAVFLLLVAALMVVGSLERLVNPEPIAFREALWVAVLGLVVNLVCAALLAGHGGHSHGHGHHHGDHHGDHHDAESPSTHRAHHAHQDLNLKAAYLHVVADAATSVLAIVALLGGWWMGWGWLDPVMGIAGSVLVAFWAKGLIQQTAQVLLDREMGDPVVEEIREVIAQQGASGHTTLEDLHVWRVGREAFACAISLVTHDAELSPQQVRQWLAIHEEIVHSTIEIHRCPLPRCGVAPAA
jgi:cation diffusion facilitator family transporter